jgi:hypothetical protein
MRGKAALLVGLAAGYVLGTRDGRERYEQIKTQANKLMNDPRVQEKASQATDLAKDKAPVLKDKVAGVAHRGGKQDSGSDSGTSGTGTGWVGDSGAGTGSQSGDSVDAASEDGAIIVSAPPPSPLEPGATGDTPTSGGLNG